MKNQYYSIIMSFYLSIYIFYTLGPEFGHEIHGATRANFSVIHLKKERGRERVVAISC